MTALLWSLRIALFTFSIVWWLVFARTGVVFWFWGSLLASLGLAAGWWWQRWFIGDRAKRDSDDLWPSAGIGVALGLLVMITSV